MTADNVLRLNARGKKRNLHRKRILIGLRRIRTGDPPRGSRYSGKGTALARVVAYARVPANFRKQHKDATR